MNLAFLTKRYDTIGGAERDVYEVTRRLANAGHEIHIYCYDIRLTPEDSIKLHRVPVMGVGRTAKVWSLACLGARQAFQGGHDLIISYARVCRQDLVRCGGGVHEQFLKRLARTEVPWKNYIRRIDPSHRSKRAIERLQYRPGAYRKILAVSEAMKRDVMRAFGVPAERIDVLHHGTDTDRFHPHNQQKYRNAIRERFGIHPQARVVLFVGNAFKRKGLDTLFRALHRIQQDDLTCLVVGRNRQAFTYRKLADTLHIADRVVFAGSQSQTHPFFAAADCFVLPSLYEPFGLVALEALASGVPAVISRSAGASEIMSGKLADYILNNPTDTEELAALLTKVLQPNAKGPLADLARQTAERFSYETHMQKFERVLIEMVEEKRASASTQPNPGVLLDRARRRAASMTRPSVRAPRAGPPATGFRRR